MRSFGRPSAAPFARVARGGDVPWRNRDGAVSSSVTSAADFLGDFDATLEAYWPEYHGVIVGNATAKTSPLTELRNAHGVAGPLNRFAEHYRDQDFRAVASLWTQWLVGLTWPPLVTAALVLEVIPALHRADAILAEEGRAAGLVVPTHWIRAPSAILLERLVRRDMAPILVATAAAGGIAPRVVWSNAAAILAWTVEQLAERLGSEQADSVCALLTQHNWSDGERNPLSSASLQSPSCSIPQRRVCCLRFRLEDFPYCPDCPVTRKR